MFTVSEIAEKLRRSRSKVYDLIKRRELGHYKVGGTIFVTQDDIDIYLMRCRVEPASGSMPKPPPVKLKHLV